VQYRFLPGNTENGMHLGVSFSPKAVRDLVSRAALPIWSANRPVGLAWLAVAVEGMPTVLSRESDHPFAEGLRVRARKRGIEMRLPLLDDEDAARISVADVWYRFPYAIEQATARYEPDVLLLGRGRADPLGPWGARGMAEMGMIPYAPAVAAALHDATGVWFDSFPLTPDRVLAGLADTQLPTPPNG